MPSIGLPRAAVFLTIRNANSLSLLFMDRTDFSVRRVEDYQYIDEGPPSELAPVVLLHGMLGDLGNWTTTIHALSEKNYRVLAPVLPVYDMALKKTSVPGLVTYVRNFLSTLNLENAVLIGNSLGGHIALLYALRFPESVSALVLAGASGIYEINIGTSTPRRQDRDFIRERTELTFYDPTHATDELVDEMYALVNDRTRALRLIRMARSAETEIVTEKLSRIASPTLLVWGQNDEITPPNVAKEFLDRLPNAQLHFIERCGHAPMIERPDKFNALTLNFLYNTLKHPSLSASCKEPSPE